MKNKFNNVAELIAYNSAHVVNGTFFIGVKNGIGLSYSIAQAQAIDKCVDLKLSHLVVDFHNHYFSKSFKTWLDWYCWLIEYLKQNQFVFSDYSSEIKSLNALRLQSF